MSSSFSLASCSWPGATLGWRRAFGWLGGTWGVAFAAEYASTRIGILFGLYRL